MCEEKGGVGKKGKQSQGSKGPKKNERTKDRREGKESMCGGSALKRGKSGRGDNPWEARFRGSWAGRILDI